MPTLKTSTSYYELLGVGPTAEDETLRKAYRRLARKHHPDVSADPRAHENMARINEAFETLIDPGRRNEYDAALSGDGRDAPERPKAKRPVVVRLAKRLHGHKTPVYAAAFAPDTGILVTVGFDNELLWWDEKGEVARRTKFDQGAVSTLRTFSLDRVAIAGAAENQVGYARVEDGRVEGWRTAQEEWVGNVAISPDGQALATGSIHETVAAVSTVDGTNLWRHARHDGAVMAVAWSADGRLVASGGSDAAIYLADGATGEIVGDILQLRAAVTALAFSPDGEYLAAGCVDLSIRVFRVADRKLVKMMFGHTKAIESLAFHPNGWLFASGSRDGTVGLWNAAHGIGNVRIEASNRPIGAVAFSADGLRLAAGGQDKIVRLWDVAAKEG